jgi:hypothetical protein
VKVTPSGAIIEALLAERLDHVCGVVGSGFMDMMNLSPAARVGTHPPPRQTKYVRVVGRTEHPEERRKDLAMKQRRQFGIDLKRHVVEELLSGMSTPAQLHLPRFMT